MYNETFADDLLEPMPTIVEDAERLMNKVSEILYLFIFIIIITFFSFFSPTKYTLRNSSGLLEVLKISNKTS